MVFMFSHQSNKQWLWCITSCLVILPHVVSAANSANNIKYSWAIAVIICLVANFVSNFGLNLQKLALTKKQSGTVRKKTYVTLWFLGFLGIIFGAIGDFAALAFGAQSIVAPLGSFTLVANVIIAPIMLGEAITRKELFATFTIVGGCALAVAFADHKDTLYTLDQLFALYETTRFIIYAIIVVTIILTMLMIIRWIERIQSQFGNNHIKYKKLMKFHRFSYAAISGIAGAQSVLFAKTCVELVTDAFAHKGSNGHPFFLAYGWTYAIFGAMALTITLQIYWLNCGLARWDALYNVPVFQSFWILISVLGGGIFYNEFSDFGIIQVLMFPLGVFFTILGVYVLSQRDSQVQVDTAKHRALQRTFSHGQNVNRWLLGTSGIPIRTGLLPPILLFSDDGMHMEHERKNITNLNHMKDEKGSTQIPVNDTSNATFSIACPDEYWTSAHSDAVKMDIHCHEIELTVHETFLGLGLQKIRVLLVDVEDPRQQRTCHVWAVSEFHRTSDNVQGPIEASGKVHNGDVLVAINGESMLDKWLSHTDAIRRIIHTTRPIRFTFRRAPFIPNQTYQIETRSQTIMETGIGAESRAVANVEIEAEAELEAEKRIETDIETGTEKETHTNVTASMHPLNVEWNPPNQTSMNSSVSKKNPSSKQHFNWTHSTSPRSNRSMQQTMNGSMQQSMNGPMQQSMNRSMNRSMERRSTIGGDSTTANRITTDLTLFNPPSDSVTFKQNRDRSITTATERFTSVLEPATPFEGHDLARSSALIGLTVDGTHRKHASRMTQLEHDDTYSSTRRNSAICTLSFEEKNASSNKDIINTNKHRGLQTENSNLSSPRQTTFNQTLNQNADWNKTNTNVKHIAYSMKNNSNDRSNGTKDTTSTSIKPPNYPFATISSSYFGANCPSYDIESSHVTGIRVPPCSYWPAPSDVLDNFKLHSNEMNHTNVSMTMDEDTNKSSMMMRMMTHEGTKEPSMMMTSHEGPNDPSMMMRMTTHQETKKPSMNMDEATTSRSSLIPKKHESSLHSLHTDASSKMPLLQKGYSSLQNVSDNSTNNSKNNMTPIQKEHPSKMLVPWKRLFGSDKEKHPFPYEMVLFVDDSAGGGTSAGTKIRTAHTQLRNIAMDPISGILHLGGLIGPTAITTNESSNPNEEHTESHPLVSLVERIFPTGGRQWRLLDLILDTFERGVRRVTSNEPNTVQSTTSSETDMNVISITSSTTATPVHTTTPSAIGTTVPSGTKHALSSTITVYHTPSKLKNHPHNNSMERMYERASLLEHGGKRAAYGVTENTLHSESPSFDEMKHNSIQSTSSNHISSYGSTSMTNTHWNPHERSNNRDRTNDKNQTNITNLKKHSHEKLIETDSISKETTKLNMKQSIDTSDHTREKKDMWKKKNKKTCTGPSNPIHHQAATYHNSMNHPATAYHTIPNSIQIPSKTHLEIQEAIHAPIDGFSTTNQHVFFIRQQNEMHTNHTSIFALNLIIPQSFLSQRPNTSIDTTVPSILGSSSTTLQQSNTFPEMRSISAELDRRANHSNMNLLQRQNESRTKSNLEIDASKHQSIYTNKTPTTLSTLVQNHLGEGFITNNVLLESRRRANSITNSLYKNTDGTSRHSLPFASTPSTPALYATTTEFPLKEEDETMDVPKNNRNDEMNHLPTSIVSFLV